MSIHIYQNVLWLQISVKNALRVQVLNCKQHFSKVEQSMSFWHRAMSCQMKEDLSSRAKVQQKMQVRGRLKSPIEFDNERMIHPLKYLPLCQYLLNLVPLSHHLLLNDLHRVYFTVWQPPHYVIPSYLRKHWRTPRPQWPVSPQNRPWTCSQWCSWEWTSSPGSASLGSLVLRPVSLSGSAGSPLWCCCGTPRRSSCFPAEEGSKSGSSLA